MVAFNVSYRRVREEDGPALRRLLAAPDSGRLGFAQDYAGDPLQIHAGLAMGDLQGGVAVHEPSGEIIGVGFADLGDTQWNGRLCPSAYVFGIRVHPAYRRRGVAAGLVRWGAEELARLVGEGFLAYGAVQAGNVTARLTHPFAPKTTRVIQGGVLPGLSRPPGPSPDLAVGPAEESEFQAFAAGANAFYQATNLWRPLSRASLARFVNQKAGPQGPHPNRLYVVRRQGSVIGGLSISDRRYLMPMRVQAPPLPVRWLGRLTGVLGADGAIRPFSVRHVWFQAGELEAGRYLWRQVRWGLSREGEGSFGIAYDPTSPLAQVFRVLPGWPLVQAQYLVLADDEPLHNPFVYCTAGA